MNTITPKYWGRTGNVLFQIAAAIYYSNKQNIPFILDEYEGFPHLKKYKASALGLDESKYKETLREHNESDIHNGVPFPENGNILLSGFFQDYRICDEYKNYIFEVLGVHSIRSNVVLKLIHPLFQSNGLFQYLYSTSSPMDDITVSLHIRRGDYETLKCYFLLLDEYYYKNALMHILKQLAIPISNEVTDQFIRKRVNVVCFYETKSQEPAKKIIEYLKKDEELMQYPIKFFYFTDLYMQTNDMNNNITDIEEMAVMSHCDHHIIANSTFSWWASYINPSINKIVCCPNEWYNHQLYYLSIEGFKSEGCVTIPAWNCNKLKCDCFTYV